MITTTDSPPAGLMELWNVPRKHSALETLILKLNTRETPLVDTDLNSTTADLF